MNWCDLKWAVSPCLLFSLLQQSSQHALPRGIGMNWYLHTVKCGAAYPASASRNGC